MIKSFDYDQVQFKSQKLLFEFENDLKGHVRQMVLTIANRFYQLYGIPFIITSVIRDGSGDHSTGLAVDIRAKTLSAQVISEIVNRFNEFYPRSKKIRLGNGKEIIARTAYAHGTGNSFHIHVAHE